MSSTTEAIATHPEIEVLMVKASDGLADPTREERFRYGFILLTTFRRLETVYVQQEMGLIESAMTEGFERSALSILAAEGGLEWWQSAKGAFSTVFANHVDSRIAASKAQGIHLGLGASK